MIGVVGCGTMGAGIAELCARSGSDVRVVASSAASAEAGRRRISAVLDRGLRKGTVTESGRDAVLARISFTADLLDLAESRLVFESVPEREELKADVFRALDKVVEDDTAILASNTSSIPIVRLARATQRPHRVVGTHFFNPVSAMPLVELVSSALTGEDTVAAAREFLSGALGRRVIEAPDRAGFVVNALLIPFLLAAARMVEGGPVSAETVDEGMVRGCSHPLGPLRLADLIGLDVVVAVADALHDEFREPQYVVPPGLRRLTEAGATGRKSGRGFYDYAEGGRR
ncbi:3-hydroxybutyryl-CoA dehydrogenase [Amycolatopsis sp.]|uniref:3-hydroxybutyryl-CoA dehydrogenase n=1 Tax=Amycolatopsis sp. TaxID=37632 RepID=UPI002BBA5437|nr:3-hydroxybutyryl-CoA dehydrogenase [Amycolatopsis sp.]HVV11373.1 3-hydroxybutyryl-CoA dehydrogenase [Amycolatopsis sp.]